MDFNEKDLVVITGYIEKNKSRDLVAKLFKVCFIGLRHLIVRPLNGYRKVPFKVKKSDCIKIKPNKQLNELEIKPKIGSLVLFFEFAYDGEIKKHQIGHIQEIHCIPGSDPIGVISSNNKTHEVNLDSVLILEV